MKNFEESFFLCKLLNKVFVISRKFLRVNEGFHILSFAFPGHKICTLYEKVLLLLGRMVPRRVVKYSDHHPSCFDRTLSVSPIAKLGLSAALFDPRYLR